MQEIQKSQEEKQAENDIRMRVGVRRLFNSYFLTEYYFYTFAYP